MHLLSQTKLNQTTFVPLDQHPSSRLGQQSCLCLVSIFIQPKTCLLLGLASTPPQYAISERNLSLLIAKRSLISRITSLLGDAVKLLSCVTKVVDNFFRAVEAPVPIVSDIESLKNALNEIAQDLQKEDQNQSNSPSDSQPSATQESTASSFASSCIASLAITRCTETVTLSTSFLSGTMGSSTVQSVTTQVCNIITACGESASTAFSTVSTATSTSGIFCATDCAACANPVVKRDNSLYHREPLEKRSLDDPNDFDSANQCLGAE